MTDDLNVLDEQEVPPGAEPAPPCDDVRAERDRFYDLLLRKTAEFDNYRKRIERERQAWADGTIGDVIGDVLPVIDDLERALKTETSGEQVEAYRKGVELIHRRLLDMLKRRGVTVVESVGQPFDPHRHQAVIYEPAEGRPDGEVIEEFARGYLIGDRLLRPAMVKVAKA